jgi:regulator of nucleoside diphosphate kinase
MEKIAYSGRAKPPIHISETDYALIASQAMRLEATAPQVAEMLLEEIDRAQVHSRDELPRDVVTLGSVVTFVDESTGVRRRVQIVLPADADIERGSLSVGSQVGAGLIGLKAGQSIDWPCPDGRPRTLRIVDVEQYPAVDRPSIGPATAGAERLEDRPLNDFGASRPLVRRAVEPATAWIQREPPRDCVIQWGEPVQGGARGVCRRSRRAD